MNWRNVIQTFDEWVLIRESTIWERHKELPTIFKSTYYDVPTTEQVEEFQRFPHLTPEDIIQGFGYTIVGRGVNSPENDRKIIESIKKLVDRYPDNESYQVALVKAKEKRDGRG